MLSYPSLTGRRQYLLPRENKTTIDHAARLFIGFGMTFRFLFYRIFSIQYIPMRRFLFLTILFVAALLSVTGCRLLNVENQVFDSSLSEELLDALAAELDRDVWSRNTSWTPETSVASQTESDHALWESRWLFGDRSIYELLNRVDALASNEPHQFDSNDSPAGENPPESKPTTLAAERHKDSKDHIFHNEHHSDSTEEFVPNSHLSNRYLTALAKRDDLSGWNAAIILAHRAPRNAVSIAKRLKELVTTPPYYDAKTKQRVDSNHRAKRLEHDRSHQPETFTQQKTGQEKKEESPNAPENSNEDQQDSLKDVSKPLSAKELAKELAKALAPESEQLSRNNHRGIQTVWNRIRGKRPTEIPQADTKRVPRPISESMHAAAAEAWCRVLAEGSSNRLDGLAPAARLLENSGQNPQIDESAVSRILSHSGQVLLSDSVRGELFRGIAYWVPPGRMTTLDDVFKGLDKEDRTSLELRKAAIEACLIYAFKIRTESTPSMNAGTTSHRSMEFDSSLWPSNILNYQFDPETSVRRMFGRWVALVGHPQAFEVLQSQLLDKEFKVRESALFNLGVLGTQESQKLLRNQSRRSEERIRTGAVKGLAHWGPLEIQPFLQDDSFHVRQVVAEELARHANASAALLIRALLIDSNNQVQAAAVHAMRDWPDELALPLLLHGLRDSSSATRVKCFTQFRKRTNLQVQFPLNAPHRQRTEATVQLARQLNLSSSHLDTLLRKGFRETRQQVDELQIAEIKSQLNDLVEHPPSSPVYSSALNRLMQLSVRELPVIEQILLEMPATHPKIIDSELLPSLSPVYSALYEIENPDVQVRRRGAQKLAYQGEQASLSRLATQRLKSVLTHEQDRLVWRYAMLAVSRDATEESDQISLLALNHNWPDIRILGCRYIARHPKPQHAVWLLNLNLFNDSNKEVKLAAVEAAGLCRNPIVLDGLEKPVFVPGVDQQAVSGSLGGLRSLLNDPDQRVRFAATIGMSRLGDPQGTQELIRMSYQSNPTVRLQVIEQMGKTGRTLFVEHLIRLVWTESNPFIKRAILGSLNQLIPEETRPGGLTDVSGLDDKIKRWVDWERRQRNQTHLQSR